MIINIPTEVLDKPMRILSSVSDAKQTMPILGNTLLRLAGGSLELVASDLEVEVRYLNSEAGVDGEISSTIPTKKFSDILSIASGENYLYLFLVCKKIDVIKRFPLKTGKGFFHPIVFEH